HVAPVRRALLRIGERAADCRERMIEHAENLALERRRQLLRFKEQGPLKLIVRELLRQALVFVAQARRPVVGLRKGALAQAIEHQRQRGHLPPSQPPAALRGSGESTHGCPPYLVLVAARRIGSKRSGVSTFWSLPQK